MKMRQMLFALLAGMTLSGCAHDQLKSMGDDPADGMVGNPTPTFNVPAVSNEVSLNYQWYFNGTNIAGAGDPLKSTGGAPTNGIVGNRTPASNVSTASNGNPVFYQWYINGTNIGGTTNR